jgi:mannose/fructose/N-acetylgalactosamine-specific phosphotransferase system component IID
MSQRVPLGIRLRAWPLDATWHAARQQGLGVCFALLPILRRCADAPRSLARHTVPFGCNAWTAPLLVGAMARLESEGRGEEAERLQQRLAAPLSAVGDLHVWKAVRPAALTVALLGVLVGQPVAGVLLATLLHGLTLTRTWVGGFRGGWELGGTLEGAFAEIRPNPRWDRALQAGLGVVAGGLAAWGLLGGWGAAPSTAFLMGGALVVGYHAAQRSTGTSVAFLGWVLLASVLGRFSNPVGPP